MSKLAEKSLYLAKLERRLREQRNAERSASIVCIVVTIPAKREASLGESTRSGYRALDILTCLHGVSYTMPCAKCKRSKLEAERERKRIKALLSID